VNPLTEEQLATNIYHDRNFSCDAAKILPGEYYFTVQPMLLVTVLGSCVAACVRDKVSGIGGMNHFMLPDGGETGPNSESMRYGAYAMDTLIGQLLRAGARRENLEAKVFGGGNVLRSFTTMNVGERNAEFVQQYLREQHIPIIAHDLNDLYPRKVYYFPQTGQVLVKKLKQMNNHTLVRREQNYANRLRTTTEIGDNDLI
jgi:chemotaxis protein CheD